MGYVVKNDTVQKPQMKIPTARQEDIKASILKRRAARLIQSA